MGDECLSCGHPLQAHSYGGCDVRRCPCAKTGLEVLDEQQPRREEAGMDGICPDRHACQREHQYGHACDRDDDPMGFQTARTCDRMLLLSDVDRVALLTRQRELMIRSSGWDPVLVRELEAIPRRAIEEIRRMKEELIAGIVGIIPDAVEIAQRETMDRAIEAIERCCREAGVPATREEIIETEDSQG